MDLAIKLKPLCLPDDDGEDAPFVPSPDSECLIRVEVEGLGSFRVLLSVQPSHHNMASLPADVLAMVVWKQGLDGSGDDDPAGGILPVFVEDEEDEDDVDEDDEDEAGGDVVLVPGPAPEDGDEDEDEDDEDDEEDEEEDEYSGPLAEFAELGASPTSMWLFEPTHGILMDHPSGSGTYCPVCGWVGTLPVLSPCPECATRNALPPDLRAAAKK